MDDSEDDVLAYMAFPAQYRTKLHSTNPLERLNKEVKRRADVVGIFPSEASIIRLIGAVLLEANDEWQMQHRYMGVEAMGDMLNPPPTQETLQLPPRAAWAVATSSPSAFSTTLTDATATCDKGRPLPCSSTMASRLNSSVNSRRVFVVIRALGSQRSLSKVSTVPGEGHRSDQPWRMTGRHHGFGAQRVEHRSRLPVSPAHPMASVPRQQEIKSTPIQKTEFPQPARAALVQTES